MIVAQTKAAFTNKDRKHECKISTEVWPINSAESKYTEKSEDS